MTAKSRWAALDTKRSTVLQRAYRACDVSIPGMIPRPGQTDQTPLPTPYQSLVAFGVNNLASKLLLALFPSGTSFFRFTVTNEVKANLGGDMADVQNALAALEQKVTTKVETSNNRSTIFEILRHLIVAGNVLLFMPKKGGIKLYRLDQFVVVRDGFGNPVEAITKECLSPSAVSDEVRQIAGVKEADTTDLDIYTHIRWSNGSVEYQQEVSGKKIPSSYGRIAAEKSPWIALRWNALANEDYGRSLVMEYMGDILSLETNSQSFVEFSEAAARILYLLHPNSSTDADDLASADSGDVITGSKEDIDILQLEKYADFRVVESVMQKLETRLSYCFLLQSGTVRNAERVTAEEIRALAQELEDALGGVYSVLAQEFQLPYLRRVLYTMTAAGELPALPKGAVNPIITTGFDALGRNHTLNRLRGWVADLVNTFGEAAIQSRLDFNKIATAYATGWSVEDAKQYIKTDAQVNAENQQNLTDQATLAAVPHAAAAAARQAGDTQAQG